MIGLKIDEAKRLFFDRQEVDQAMDRATKQALSRFGAFVRTRARSSIRKRKRVSEPGSPPSSHTGLLKNFLFFVYEPSGQGVVIGPVRLNTPDAAPAPALLEHGGSVTVTRKTRGGKQRQVRRVYRERPFMGPAFEAELPGLPGLWHNAVLK